MKLTSQCNKAQCVAQAIAHLMMKIKQTEQTYTQKHTGDAAGVNVKIIMALARK